ncbi:hypothetical protein [Streptomyces sp. S.PB5]|uniref:hypothetical protein n=1 Tax=Streptomyces sp. S.PB5 TaxID=3020844 RepID=UPI00339D3F7E
MGRRSAGRPGCSGSDPLWRGRQIGGAVLVDFRPDDPSGGSAEQLGMPVVAVGHPSLTGSLTSVWTDDATAVTEAVRYLAALDARRRYGGRPVRGSVRRRPVRRSG